MTDIPVPLLLSDATQAHIRWTQTIQKEAITPFAAAAELARMFGAQPLPDGTTRLGFWVPQLRDRQLAPDDIQLELYQAAYPVDLRQREQIGSFQRVRLPVASDGEYVWAIISGMQAGNRQQCGTLYRLIYRQGNQWRSIHDPLAASLPFGAFAPAEYYDVEQMLAARTDTTYFHSEIDLAPDNDGISRVQPPAHVLQIHTGLTSPEGSLAGLARQFQQIADAVVDEEVITPAELHFYGYDAIQLMPLEPVVEYESGPAFFDIRNEADDLVTVMLRKPDMTNWGYDTLVSGAAAINPALLETGRPDELLDLIQALHNFPNKPIKLILDVVFGHADNQALRLLSGEYFAGANRYGQNVNSIHPMVRAVVLEMLRRKLRYGVDGVRVSGAHDLRWWEPESNQLVHDDELLRLLGSIEIEVDNVSYRPWMVFEDARPYPESGWELRSSYRAVTRNFADAWQMGPLSFSQQSLAVTTGFWAANWWRIREIATQGSHWVNGYANHNTLRDGTRVALEQSTTRDNPAAAPQVIAQAYDSPASHLLKYAVLPGVPLDFLHALLHAPWGFFRNTDDRYAAKIVGEESRWIRWRVDTRAYATALHFRRVKALGFTKLEELWRLIDALAQTGALTGYYLDQMVRLLNDLYPPLAGVRPLSVAHVKEFARAYMDDVAEYCNLRHYRTTANGPRAVFQALLRDFRREHRWLIEDFAPGDWIDYRHPMAGSMVCCAVRQTPGGGELLALVACLEGASVTVQPQRLFPELPSDRWYTALLTPAVDSAAFERDLHLDAGQGVVFIRPA